MAVAKLDALKLAAATGEVPQNVNFAIKAAYLRSILQANGVEDPNDMFFSAAKGNEDVAARAKAISLNIECRPDAAEH